MVVSQIGNGDFPLNNCAILRGVLEPNQIDFIQSFLRGDALRNPIAELAGGVKSAINDALVTLPGIGSFSQPIDANGDPIGDPIFNQTQWASNLENAVQSFQSGLVEFEQRTIEPYVEFISSSVPVPLTVISLPMMVELYSASIPLDPYEPMLHDTIFIFEFVSIPTL